MSQAAYPATPATLLAVLALLGACGGAEVSSHRSATPPPPRAAEPPPPDALDARLAKLSERARSLGAEPMGAVTRGFLATGESTTVEVSAPAGACLTITVLASAGVRDLDTTLYAPSGDVLAQDTAEDAHPTLQLCAPGPAARRAYVFVRAYNGTGAYLLATFRSLPAVLPALAQIVGGTPGVASDNPEAVAADDHLRDFALGASARGFSLRGAPRPVPLAATQTVRLPLSIAAAECVSLIALAEGGLEDVDAQLLDADGTELARDIGTGPDATLQYCADTAAERTLALTAVRGQGNARVAVFVGPATRVGGTSGLWLGQRAANLASARPLDVGVAAARAHAAADGYSVRGPSTTVTLARGGVSRSTTRVPANTCVRLEATAGPGVARPYLLASANGAPVAEREGRGAGEPAVIDLCTPTALDLDVALVARASSGDVALTVSSRALAADSAAAPH